MLTQSKGKKKAQNEETCGLCVRTVIRVSVKPFCEFEMY